MRWRFNGRDVWGGLPLTSSRSPVLGSMVAPIPVTTYYELLVAGVGDVKIIET